MIDVAKIANAMGELDENAVLEVINQIMAEGGGAAQEALAACQKGLGIVGDKFESGEYFVADLIYAGAVMTEAVGLLKPALASEGATSSRGKMILCTVKDDLHDIGKNIVKSMLEAASFDVLDLGIDVAPETVVSKAKEEGITIIALSGVLTLALESMKATVEAFKAAGMRECVHIIIGGIPVNEEACKYVGADAWAHSPQVTVRTCEGWSAGPA